MKPVANFIVGGSAATTWFRDRRKYVHVAWYKTLPTQLLLHCWQPRVYRQWKTRSRKSICEQIDLRCTASPGFEAPETKF